MRVTMNAALLEILARLLVVVAVECCLLGLNAHAAIALRLKARNGNGLIASLWSRLLYLGYDSTLAIPGDFERCSLIGLEHNACIHTSTFCKETMNALVHVVSPLVRHIVAPWRRSLRCRSSFCACSGLASFSLPHQNISYLLFLGSMACSFMT